MAAELANGLGIEAEMLPEGEGIFDVVLDGQIIFSKYNVHRFPNTGEIADLVRAIVN
ncbi:MAG: Rdx family protein [Pseudomonadales bacterium]